MHSFREPWWSLTEEFLSKRCCTFKSELLLNIVFIYVLFFVSISVIIVLTQLCTYFSTYLGNCINRVLSSVFFCLIKFHMNRFHSRSPPISIISIFPRALAHSFFHHVTFKWQAEEEKTNNYYETLLQWMQINAEIEYFE